MIAIGLRQLTPAVYQEVGSFGALGLSAVAGNAALRTGLTQKSYPG